MKPIPALLTSFALAIPLLCAPPAYAQASRTWVSGVGDDANPCSRTAPCKTYAGTISKTAAGGEINCLDPGGFGTVTITKSISIVCDYTEGGVLSAATTGFTINTPAGGIVTLRGQDIECFTTGLNGIRILGSGVTVNIQKVHIRNCRGSGSGGNGIVISHDSGLARVFVTDSDITDSGGPNGQSGILIRPTAGATADVSVNRVRLVANSSGIYADGSGGAGSVNLAVHESDISGSSYTGIAVSSIGGTFKGVVTNSTINFNANVGVGVKGSVSSLWLGGSTVTGNGTGVLAVASGALISLMNNTIVGNTTNGTPISLSETLH